MLCENPIFIKNVSDYYGPLKRFLKVSCGKCSLCRTLHAKEWGLRSVMEWMTQKDNCYFLTLTYDDKNVDLNLHKEHIQDFIKKLRNKFRQVRFKYFCAGEFGDQTLRPHYHMLLFGLPLNDCVVYKINGGNILYSSKLINEMWGRGYVVIGDLNMNTAFYTARYALKKVGKDNTIQLQSQGIGKEYFLQNWQQIINCRFILLNGIKYKIPRYFFSLYSKLVDEKSYFDYVRKNYKEYLDYCLFLQLKKSNKFNYVFWQSGLVDLPHLEFLEKSNIDKNNSKNSLFFSKKRDFIL